MGYRAPSPEIGGGRSGSSFSFPYSAASDNPPVKDLTHPSTSPLLPDISSSNEHGLLALLAGDAVHRELGDIVTAVSVHLWQLWGRHRPSYRVESLTLSQGQ